MAARKSSIGEPQEYMVVGLRRKDDETAQVDLARMEGEPGAQWVAGQVTVECPLSDAPALGAAVDGTFAVRGEA